MKFTWGVDWLNWTFGFWFGRYGRTGRWIVGVDLGPLEMTWRDKRGKF